ncbi:hypothetical protein FACS189491_05040 [Spirochaetia bacterium]|nr:hypothetical protein FACS189491_05040 [Spirochaetia bacterium]
MRKLYGVLLSLLFIMEGCVAPKATSGRWELSESKLNRLSLAAMAGDGEAAWMIVHNYEFPLRGTTAETIRNAEKWALIGAENGHLGAHETVGDKLSYEAGHKSPTRAVFWWRLLFKNGGNSIISRFDYYGLSENFDFPPDASFPASYTAISAETISACEEGALQGSGRAALLLAQYYGNAAGDAGLSEYWYRIGVQNGNAECQHNLGLIYQAKPEGMNKVRGTFWLQRAAENGYVEPPSLPLSFLPLSPSSPLR